MAKDSLYVTLQKMKNESPLIAACMHALNVNKKQLVEGLNSIEGLEVTFEIFITKKGYKEEVIQFSKGELMKRKCQTNNTAIIVSCVCLVVLLMVSAEIWNIFNSWKMKKIAKELEGIYENPDYGDNGPYFNFTEVK